MKYIIIIYVLLLAFINSKKTSTPSNQLLLIEQFVYNGLCSTSDNNYELAPSNECSNKTIFDKSIIKLSQCTNFQMQPALFTYDSNTNQIVQEIYSDDRCKKYVDSKYHTLGSCNSTCLYGQGMTFIMSLIQDIDLPNSTLVSVLYSSKDCNGQYKDNFIEIDYSYLNYCQVYTISGVPPYSVKTFCNETTQTNYIYKTKSCKGTPHIEYYPLYNVCGVSNIPYLNYYQFCNN